jgi:hypothetical protein
LFAIAKTGLAEMVPASALVDVTSTVLPLVARLQNVRTPDLRENEKIPVRVVAMLEPDAELHQRAVAFVVVMK